MPGSKWSVELEFLHDTGASMMTLYEHDFAYISKGEPPTLLAMVDTTTSDGRVLKLPVTEVEVTVEYLKKNHKTHTMERFNMTKWARVTCQVLPRWKTAGTDRLDGPWLHQMLYTATAPTFDRLIISNTLDELRSMVPNKDDNARSATPKRMKGFKEGPTGRYIHLNPGPQPEHADRPPPIHSEP